MEPLAIKLRPNSLNDVIGQTHLIGSNKILSNLVKNTKIFSMILYGKPGIGKTTIATSLVNDLNIEYKLLNAVIDKKSDFDTCIALSLEKELVIIVDEIHRLNKDKQDILLPHLEKGNIILIGLTTSNPYHKINPAIRSRCQIFELKELNDGDILTGLNKAILHLPNIKVEEDSLNFIVKSSSGDLRAAYNLLEVCYYACNKEISIDNLKRIESKPIFFHDSGEDGHYDVLSGFQKSIRGSDPDAAIHYLARLIEVGDLDSIYRRMSVIVYEDIGMANPMMGVKVEACINACERVGLPEARIILAQTIIEMALSPKSNSAELAIDLALSDIRSGNTGNLPVHLRTNSKTYLYPHNYKNSYVKQQYLPDNLLGKKYYYPKNNKNEQMYKEIMDKLKKID